MKGDRIAGYRMLNVKRKYSISIFTILAIVAIIVLYFLIQGMIGVRSIEIDGAKRYQRIDGFGGSGAYYEWLLRSLREPYRTEAVDLLFSDLGVNIYRLRAWTKIEIMNDDDDPNNFNWEVYNFTVDQDQVWNAIEAKKRGVTKFIASVWSPPAWMKSNMEETNDGYLLPEMYEEYAEWLSAYILGYKRYHGIDIGWISLQNEPDYTAAWETCIYTPEQLRDLIKVVGRRFEREGIDVKIVIPETSGVQNAIRYIETIMSDPDAARYVDVFAVHLYDIPFTSPDQGVSWLRSIASYCTRYGKPLWMTEYSYLDYPYAGTYEEALYTAQHIHNTLVYGNASVYLVWELFWYRGTGLISISREGDHYNVTPKYYAVKQFFKFIRPDSVRIGANSDNPQILVSAYLNEESGDITIVVINRGKSDITVKILLKNLIPPQYFKQYRTSRMENCRYIGDVKVIDGTLELILPSESITTLTTYRS